jgi:hypothetical protein
VTPGRFAGLHATGLLVPQVPLPQRLEGRPRERGTTVGLGRARERKHFMTERLFRALSATLALVVALAAVSLAF